MEQLGHEAMGHGAMRSRGHGADRAGAWGALPDACSLRPCGPAAMEPRCHGATEPWRHGAWSLGASGLAP
eukprot:11806286-Alexandrium_andersonii.AAC.1